jgi:plastocyanin
MAQLVRLPFSVAPREIKRRGFLVAAVIILGSCAAANPPAEAQIGGSKPINVELKQLKFSPKSVRVAPNSKINFVWKENVAHNIVFSTGGFKSKTQNKGTFVVELKKAGTYKYKCTLHPGMDGSIVVK